jgi:hypothetical protein
MMTIEAMPVGGCPRPMAVMRRFQRRQWAVKLWARMERRRVLARERGCGVDIEQ